MKASGYSDSIFINCPFDSQYFPLLRAIIFTIYRCGFYPKCALTDENGLYRRLDKIEDCIANSQFGIHDISRTELSNNLPRFNMPFELGMFFGAQLFGNKIQKSKNALIFDIDRYRYLMFISDLNGVDIKAHRNDPLLVIRQIRDWLRAASGRSTIPGHTILIEEYLRFLNTLPGLMQIIGLDEDDIPFNDFCEVIEKTFR